MSNTEEGYATAKDICQVSLCGFSLLIDAVHNFQLLAFLQITLNAIIYCIVKSNKCFEMDLDIWRDVNEDGLQLLLLLDLKHYRKKFPDGENLQDE